MSNQPVICPQSTNKKINRFKKQRASTTTKFSKYKRELIVCAPSLRLCCMWVGGVRVSVRLLCYSDDLYVCMLEARCTTAGFYPHPVLQSSQHSCSTPVSEVCSSVRTTCLQLRPLQQAEEM